MATSCLLGSKYLLERPHVIAKLVRISAAMVIFHPDLAQRPIDGHLMVNVAHDSVPSPGASPLRKDITL